ncbi:MAG: RsmB/NOP family class I SAM-dependent RNA methyltransferase [Pseudomonadota bacterium]|nr:RsmB/NOP family class I SAM-dependent RNA methyltransferase [Pseudomonadota bacterium]
MTPAARVQAAIEVLDRIISGDAAENALTTWARGARYAGSKDRAAVRDHVFDVLRCWRSCAALGGGDDGRALMLGLLRAQGGDVPAMFSGEGHAPEPLTDTEMAACEAPQGAAALDLPEWLWPLWKSSLGDQAEATALAQRTRADVFLRVNLAAATVDEATTVLAEDGIVTQPHPLSPTAMRVVENARRVHQNRAYQDGLVELQDAASQALVDRLPLPEGGRVLDYCAGGGGKSLAMAALCRAQYYAHDIDVRRMKDLPDRAERAGARVQLLSPTELKAAGQFDLVLCDAPCSGSGSWRRAPEGKWLLSEERLHDLCDIQAEILDKAKDLVAAGGVLAYATCSVLSAENQDQSLKFVSENPDWQQLDQVQFLPEDGGDGFYCAVFKRR